MEHAALQTWDWQLGTTQLQTQLTLLQTTEWEQKGKIIYLMCQATFIIKCFVLFLAYINLC